MGDPMRIRAVAKGGSVIVKILMSHPMETGQRKVKGKVVPAHFIENITVKVNGKTVIEAQTSQAVSRNPVFAFRAKGGAKGDKVEIGWVDNEGETNSIEAAVA